MRTTIEVADREEGALIRTALEDPEVRALVKVIGVLKPMPTKRMQRLTLELAEEHLRAGDAKGSGHEESL